MMMTMTSRRRPGLICGFLSLVFSPHLTYLTYLTCLFVLMAPAEMKGVFFFLPLDDVLFEIFFNSSSSLFDSSVRPLLHC